MSANQPDIAELRNQMVKPLQYCLWLGETRILGVIRVYFRVFSPDTDALYRDHPLEYPSRYAIWNADVITTDERDRKVSTRFMGKTLNDMEVIAWTAELGDRDAKLARLRRRR
jgi:hypothetical protein